MLIVLISFFSLFVTGNAKSENRNNVGRRERRGLCICLVILLMYDV